jgi:hypothetical protein
VVRTVVRRQVDQLDLFAELEEAQRVADGADARQRFDEAPAIFDPPARGLRARLDTFDAWVDQHGNFDCLARSHGWHTPGSEGSTAATESCRPAVLTAQLRCHHDNNRHHKCCCVGDLVSRAACTGCDWEGELHGDVAAAAEDAHDHAWPGWRALPVVPRPPEHGSHPKLQARLAEWVENVNAFYPHGWLESGGPIRTDRARMGTRHVPEATGFGGWDMAVRAGCSPFTSRSTS